MQVKLRNGRRRYFGKWRKGKTTITFWPAIEYYIDDDCFDSEIFVKVEALQDNGPPAETKEEHPTEEQPPATATTPPETPPEAPSLSSDPKPEREPESTSTSSPPPPPPPPKKRAPVRVQ